MFVNGATILCLTTSFAVAQDNSAARSSPQQEGKAADTPARRVFSMEDKLSNFPQDEVEHLAPYYSLLLLEEEDEEHGAPAAAAVDVGILSHSTQVAADPRYDHGRGLPATVYGDNSCEGFTACRRITSAWRGCCRK
jgi:hypothetical protein